MTADPSSLPTRQIPDASPWRTHADEIALLLACVRTDDPGKDLRPLLDRTLDWSFVLQQAGRHGIDPMLYHHLDPLDGAALPENVTTTLQKRSEGVRVYNLHRLRALVELVQVLDEEDIPVLSFKGPLLADRYYGNLGLRRFADLDLLVPRTHLRRAVSVLAAEDFDAPNGRSKEEEARRIQDQVGLEFVRSTDRLKVELHWSLLNRSFAFPLATETVQARAHGYEVGSTTIQTLSDEDCLLYLCAHGTKHHWARIKWICDVAQVCRRADGLDWNRLVERAVQLDLDRMLFLGLRLAEQCLGAPVPGSLHDRLYGDSTVDDLADQVRTQWLFTEEGLDRTPRWNQFWFFLRTRRRWRNRWPLLREYGGLAITPTEKDRALIDLPSSVSFLYYLIRPFRILGDGEQSSAR